LERRQIHRIFLFLPSLGEKWHARQIIVILFVAMQITGFINQAIDKVIPDSIGGSTDPCSLGSA